MQMKPVNEQSDEELNTLIRELREIRAFAATAARRTTVRRSTATRAKKTPKTISLTEVLEKLTPEQRAKFLALS